jgi:SAM-dependent methyltransferase
MTMFRHPMESPLVYRLWQAPFAERKLKPVLDWCQHTPPDRVLDIGCGPGTNAHHFAGVDYLGIDINPGYIETARRRYGPRFEVADARDLAAAGLMGTWDLVLMNSLMHHLPDDAVDSLLSAVPSLLGDNGRVHILDLVLPRERRASWLMARLDRGEYPRDIDAWRSLFARKFEIEAFEPYPLGAGPVELWSMVHCVGRRRER